jgi:hypothetical protein
VAVKEEKVEVSGEVVEALRSGIYRVALEGGGDEVLAYAAGKMRKFRIRIVVRRPGSSGALTLQPEPRPHRLQAPRRAVPADMKVMFAHRAECPAPGLRHRVR